MLQWHIETKKIKDLKKHPKNPRSINNQNYEHLRNSLFNFGLIEKPVVNVDGTIIGGHQRIEILKKEKIKEVDCWVPERQLEQKEVDEINIRLNRNHGAFDFEILANEWEIKDLMEWGFS